jgi:inhibitor of KinA sporulation pathway (predicted exonuclease)
MPSKGRTTYEAFLVVDVEATCDENIPFGYPNEIIVSTVVLVIFTCLTFCVV